MAFRTSWKLSMLALCVVPPISYTYRKYAKWGRKINRSIYCALGEANSVATEAIHNIRTVRGFSTGPSIAPWARQTVLQRRQFTTSGLFAAFQQVHLLRLGRGKQCCNGGNSQHQDCSRLFNRSIYCALGEANSVATEAIHNI